MDEEMDLQAAKEAVFAQWDPDNPVDRSDDVAAWAARNDVEGLSEVDIVWAWYVAADTAWVEAAMPSGTMTRGQFMDQWMEGGA